MKVPHKFLVSEAVLIELIEHYAAMMKQYRVALNSSRMSLMKYLSTLPRRHGVCRHQAARCRMWRAQYRLSVVKMEELELKLARLRCDEPLPF
ncbi:hypothetical protein [Aeromonas sp.]|uniref:hypothetical protein n=1 Tax=Aeromonas sp. TaxID=647 RepID=UPI00258DF094|nr:hypothetical protein [Aeromonas sp.]MCX7132494.1 hypothetical protein [Aeromonas sp.]